MNLPPIHLYVIESHLLQGSSTAVFKPKGIIKDPLIMCNSFCCAYKTSGVWNAGGKYSRQAKNIGFVIL